MKIDPALAEVHCLAIDTAPIIYFVEKHPRYDVVVAEFFRRIDEGRLKAVTSVITLTEVLVHPLRMGRVDLKERYLTLLSASDNFSLLPIEIWVAEQAADLRARFNLRTPDAIQLAVAISAGCDAFLTNDKRLRAVSLLNVIVLDDIVV